MQQTNYTAFTHGLKLYTDAMRGLVKDRLIAAYPNSWWESGVVGVLPPPQRENLKREMAKDPDRPKADFLDPSHISNVVAQHFPAVFKGVFHDFRKTQNLLQQVALARNELMAHTKSGDLLADDVAHALYAAGQLLATAKLPEATEVERIRRLVLKMEPSEAAAPTPSAAAPSVAAARPGELPYWWQVCEPHDAFQNPAAIDEGLFAATLGAVHAGSARRDYLDPSVFFSHTYFTDNLKQTVRDVISRMGGGAGPAATEMQTPFGGGKTHALLTLYHLLRSPEASLAVPGVREALGDIEVPHGARVLVFDGQEWGTEPITKEDGTVVQTLWGDLAYQADPGLFQTHVVGSDGRGEAPGNADFRRVLQAASPCLILLDELVSYLVKLKFANSRRTQNLYRQTVQFLQDTLQEIGNVSGACVLLSLPKSRAEFGGIDPLQLQNELAVVGDLQARADRVVAKRTPVDDDEIYTLMSKRLFKRTDPAVAAQVARMYRETYERTRGLYDPGIFSADFHQHQVAAYPFHPELVDVLYKKWSTASGFPRTRAVLQLLASIVADQWTARREAYAIQSAHVNLERERIRTRIIGAANEPGFDAVVAADVIGGDAHADQYDRGKGAEYERYRVGRGIATTLLMHSFGGALRNGATQAELRLGTVAPNVGPEYVSEVLGALEQSLWYVHPDGELLRFQTRPNVYRIVSQKAEGQSDVLVADRLAAAMKDAVGPVPGFRVLERAGADGAIENRPEPAIAVLDARYAVARQNGGSDPVGRERIDQLWDRHGGGLREWRNALVLVAPDRELWDKTGEAMREVMGYESVIGDSKLDLGAQTLKELKSRLADKNDSLCTSLVTSYRWVFYPDERGLTAISLPVPATRSERIAVRAVDRLADQNYGQPKILHKMGAIYFNSKLAPRLWKDESNPLDLSELARRFPQWTYLPILPNREETLRACVRDGIVQRLWAVAIGDPGTMRFRQLVETGETLDAFSVLFDGSACLVKGDLLELIREELAKEKAADGDGTAVIASPVDAGAGEVAADPGTIETTGTSTPPPIPPPAKRFAKVRLRIDDLRIAKTSNLQPYLFKALQDQDAAASVTLTVEVSSEAGIAADVLERRIVEGLDQLGIGVSWEPL